MFYKGKVYVVGENGRLAYCDVSPTTALTVIPYAYSFKGKNIYLMESRDELYFVARHTIRQETVRFGVLKFEFGDRWTLSPIGDLNDHVFFVGRNQSVCLATEDLNGFDGNCIYYVEQYQVDGYLNDIEPAILRYRFDHDDIECLQRMNRFFFVPPQSQWITRSVTL